MADNTVLPTGSGGDTIRTVAKTANTPAKTQVVALDIGGGADGNPETIVSAAAPMPVGVYDGTGAAVNSLSMGSGQNGLLVALGATNYFISTVNSSVAQLASNATFTGTIESIDNAQQASIDIASDQPGTLTVNQYITTNPNSICATATFPTTAIGAVFGIARAFTINGNYLNITFKNTGGSTTTLLNINTAYGTLSPTTQLLNTPVAIDEINGVALNIGQQTMANSIPVALASNQSAVPVTQATLTKGTQGSLGVSAQDLKDAGRNVTNYFMAAQVVSTATEALQSLTGYKGGVAVTATTTPAVVTTGKTYRINRIVITYVGVVTPGAIQVNLRANLSGVATTSSPLVESWLVGTSVTAVTSGTATAGDTNTAIIDIPDGMEFPAGTGLGITVLGVGVTGTATAVGYAKISMSGYEY